LVVSDDEGHYIVDWEELIFFVKQLSLREGEWLKRYQQSLASQKNASFLYSKPIENITPAFINNWTKREIFHGRVTPSGISASNNLVAEWVNTVLVDTRNDMCHHVLVGLQWILSYYSGENVDPYWQYPYSYFPMLGSLVDYLESNYEEYDELHLRIIIKKQSAINTLVHRLCVLPPHSWDTCFTNTEKKRINSKFNDSSYHLFPTGVEVSSKDLTKRRETTRKYDSSTSYTVQQSMNLPEMYFHVFATYLNPQSVNNIMGVKDILNVKISRNDLFNSNENAYAKTRFKKFNLIQKEYIKNLPREVKDNWNQQIRPNSQSNSKHNSASSRTTSSRSSSSKVNKTPSKKIDIIPLYDGVELIIKS
jgi:hypothetical protein